MRTLFFALSLIIALFLSGCHSTLSKIRILTIQQGNALHQDDIEKLKLGMTKDEVRAVLGDPVLKNTFNENRWQYIYLLDKPRAKVIEKRVTVIFDRNEKLTSFTSS